MHITRTATCTVCLTVVYQDPLLPSRRVREGLVNVTSMHGLLTNQILLLNFETVPTPWLQYVRPFWRVREGMAFNCNTILCILDHIHITAKVNSKTAPCRSVMLRLPTLLCHVVTMLYLSLFLLSVTFRQTFTTTLNPSLVWGLLSCILAHSHN